MRSADKEGGVSLLPSIKLGSPGSSACLLEFLRRCVWTGGQLLHHEVAHPGPGLSPALRGVGEVSVLQQPLRQNDWGEGR